MAARRDVGVGIWGAGWVAGTHASAYKTTPGCKIVASGSRRLESAANLAAAHSLDCKIYSDYAEFLSDPELDAVSICTPNGLHAQNTIDGAEAAKHLFIEKPVALKPEDLDRMVQAVDAAGIVTTVGFVSRGNPLVRRMRKIVQSGALGNIYIIGADYWHARVGRPVDYRTAENAGNAYMVGGVHAVDAARFITGLDVVAVCSASTQIGSAAAEGYQMDTADALLVKYSNGAVNLGILSSTFASNEFQAVQFMPMIVVPQVLLSEAFFNLGGMPGWVQSLSKIFPLTHAVAVVREVMIAGRGVTEAPVWQGMLILVAFALVFLVAGAHSLRKTALEARLGGG